MPTWNPEHDDDTVLEERTHEETALPPMYKVVLLNDNYTPMEFVVEVLIDVFHKNHQQAVQIMWDVHQAGRGVVGVYTKEVAQAKKAKVDEMAKENNHPLQVVVEPDAPSNKPNGPRP